MNIYASFVVMFDEKLKKICCSTRTDGSIGLPGGKLEEGENHIDAALREAAEEGWKIPKDTFPYPFLIRPNKDGKLISWILIVSNKRPKPLKNYKEKSRGINTVYATIFDFEKDKKGNTLALKLGSELHAVLKERYKKVI